MLTRSRRFGCFAPCSLLGPREPSSALHVACQLFLSMSNGVRPAVAGFLGMSRCGAEEAH
jgi:hypothetical protein